MDPEQEGTVETAADIVEQAAEVASAIVEQHVQEETAAAAAAAAGEAGEDDEAAEGVDRCAICYDPVEDRGVLDSCNHIFCYGCIMQWYRTGSNACPYCRARFHSIVGREDRVQGLVDQDIQVHDEEEDARVAQALQLEMNLQVPEEEEEDENAVDGIDLDIRDNEEIPGRRQPILIPPLGRTPPRAPPPPPPPGDGDGGGGGGGGGRPTREEEHELQHLDTLFSFYKTSHLQPGLTPPALDRRWSDISKRPFWGTAQTGYCPRCHCARICTGCRLFKLGEFRPNMPLRISELTVAGFETPVAIPGLPRW